MGSSLSSPDSRAFRPDNNSKTRQKRHTEDEAQAVRGFLRLYLPLELVDIIMDYAMYWPSVLARENRPCDVFASERPGSDASFVYLVTPPIPEVPEGATWVKVNMVKFQLRSRDQGWGGLEGLAGPYDASWTWFEACIYRPTVPRRTEPRRVTNTPMRGMRWKSEDELRAAGVTLAANPLNGTRVWHLQRNARACGFLKQHEIVWSIDTAVTTTNIEQDEDKQTGRGLGRGFVQSLRAGDRIAIIARALHFAWANHIQDIQVEIFYSVL